MKSNRPVATFEKVCFSYKTREILHNVDFCLFPDQMMAVVGPNGGGKTTLLKLMLGFIQPQRGKVRLFDEVPLKTRQRVGYVPQNMEFDPAFPISVQEVVALGMVHESGTGSKERRQRVGESLERVGCGHLHNRSFGTLSGGERQRVLIAHALVGGPDLLVLDEPTANVDPESEHQLYELFHALHANIPILFVSHNLNVVTSHVSHVLCVNRSAVAHPIGAVAHETFQELYGGKLSILNHDQSCHITDPSLALMEPHAASCCHDHHDHGEVDSAKDTNPA